MFCYGQSLEVSILEFYEAPGSLALSISLSVSLCGAVRRRLDFYEAPVGSLSLSTSLSLSVSRILRSAGRLSHPLYLSLCVSMWSSPPSSRILRSTGRLSTTGQADHTDRLVDLPTDRRSD